MYSNLMAAFIRPFGQDYYVDAFSASLQGNAELPERESDKYKRSVNKNRIIMFEIVLDLVSYVQAQYPTGFQLRHVSDRYGMLSKVASSRT
jgi:hypothetical protein